MTSLLGVLTLASACASSAAVPARLGPVLDEAGLSAPAWREAAVSRSLRREGRSHRFWTVVARLGSRTLRLEVTSGLSPEAAERMREDWGVRVRALYRPATTNYFGVTQGGKDTPEELKPQALYPDRGLLRRGEPVFALWSDKDLSYVLRSRAEAAHRGLSVFRYCRRTRTLVQVETFEPAGGFDLPAALRDIAAVQCSGGAE
ncbi:MAG: hypothetical protein A3J82_03500 [Elusimicrobia bacterium RIFOXYA2_FULL_69_6]|nr:MAG: hypothetical protein A3J82_03500 [Elusimicrobia bacterium RIFOXYA2_FULL_69_6]